MGLLCGRLQGLDPTGLIVFRRQVCIPLEPYFGLLFPSLTGLSSPRDRLPPLSQCLQVYHEVKFCLFDPALRNIQVRRQLIHNLINMFVVGFFPSCVVLGEMPYP